MPLQIAAHVYATMQVHLLDHTQHSGGSWQCQTQQLLSQGQPVEISCFLGQHLTEREGLQHWWTSDMQAMITEGRELSVTGRVIPYTNSHMTCVYCRSFPVTGNLLSHGCSARFLLSMYSPCRHMLTSQNPMSVHVCACCIQRGMVHCLSQAC